MFVRRLCLALAAAALLMLPDAAHANGLNLSWDACGAAGVANKQFACNTNTGYDYLVLSAEFPTAWIVDLPLTFDATLDVTSAQSALPNWWRLDPGDCRAGAITVGIESDGRYGSCTAGALASGSRTAFAWSTSGLSPERRRLTITSRPESAIWANDPLGEMLMCVLEISHSKSTGLGACTGCTTPVCIVLNSVTLYGQPWEGTPIRSYVTNPLQRNFVTWQGGTNGIATCPAATPVHNSTWGSLKSLYR